MSTPQPPMIGVRWQPGRKEDLIRFLTRLSDEDDELYDQLVEDPQSTLLDWGIELPDELIEDARKLPPKEQLGALVEGFTAEAPPPVFGPCLVAGLVLAAGAGE